MTIFEFLNNDRSPTELFQSWTDDIYVKVLQQRIVDNTYHRIAVIFVDRFPVLVAHSETALQNTTFLEILDSAESTPIGVRLFDHKLNIKMVNLEIKQIILQEIPNEFIVNYIDTLKPLYFDSIYYRQSNFTKDNQSMQLTEYALPSLQTLLDLKS